MMKDRSPKVSLVILNKNDVNGLRHIRPRIPCEHLDEVLVIDGQSCDRSVEYCREVGLRCVVQDRPGRGHAFRMAASIVKGDYTIFLSSDGNEDPADIPKFVRLLDEGYDMVIASRLLKNARNKEDGSFLPIRKWMLRAFTALVNLTWRGRLTDVWNGYLAFRTTKLRAMPTTAEGHLIELQQSVRALKLGYKIAEFPTVEGDRVAGETRNPLIRTGIGLIRTIFSEMCNS